MGTNGFIFDIQRFAVHDGPGIRSTVFFKGCSCRCAWCHNPESLSVQSQLEFYPSRCIGCGRCFEVCPGKAHYMDTIVHKIDRKRCTGCGCCASECNSAALVLKGKKMTVEEVLEIVMADKAYYQESGGGITLSGGEPVLQNIFAREVLKACKDTGFNTAIQTAGNYPYSLIESLLPSLDIIMYDFKGFDPLIYEQYIWGNRDLILGNLKRLDGEFKGVLAVRTPVVAPINDSEEEIGSIAHFLKDFKNLSYYQLLPYHGLGKAKYDALEARFASELSAPPPEKIDALEKIASAFVPVFNQEKGMLRNCS